MPQAPKFPAHSPFRADLNARVDAYFEETGLSRSGGGGQAFKNVVIVSWYVLSYVALVFFAVTWWQVLLAATSLSLALCGIGFAVMHDGNHEASFQNKKLNRLSGAGLDLVGASSYVWRYKHNVVHHQFPNVAGVDDDLEAEPFLRMAPAQPRYPWHRFQHIYVPLAYAWLPAKWHWFDDYNNVITGKIGDIPMPRPKGWDLFQFVGFKAFLVVWAVIVPLMLHPWWAVLGVYAFCSFVVGNVLATTFQLAHCLDAAEMPDPPADGERLQQPWAEHQLATTVDFAQGNPFLGWYLGGLNFQIEHHLFQRISNRHYPAISKIVKEVCAEHGIEYRTHDTLFQAIRSHLRWLREMGKPVKAAPAEPVAALA